MSTLFEVSNTLKEIQSSIKTITKSQASGQAIPELFVFACGAPGTNKFSLPATVFAADLIANAAFSYMYSSQASLSAIPVAAATKHEIRNGPLDLSTFHVFVAAAASGATLHAWVQRGQA